MTRTVESASPSSSRTDDRRPPPYHASWSLSARGSSRSACRSCRGFTMVEMVFVAAIILVIMTFAIPGITAAQRGYELSTAGDTIVSKLDDTRTNALKRNQNTWLLVDPVAMTLQVQFTSGGSTVNLGAATYLSKNLSFVGISTAQQVMFDALGRPVSPPQTIQFQHNATGWQRTVTVSSTGRISVQ